jgi:hypothetical protein
MTRDYTLQDGCRLQLLLALASRVIRGSESRETHDHILLSQIPDAPSLEGQVPVFIPPRNRVAQLCPLALGSLFVSSYDSQGYGGGIRIRLHASVDQSVRVGVNFTNGGLPLIGLSWRHDPWGHDQRFFFGNWTLAVIVRITTSSLTRGWVRLFMNMLALCQGCVWHM